MRWSTSSKRATDRAPPEHAERRRCNADTDGVGELVAELDGAARRIATLSELNRRARGEHRDGNRQQGRPSPEHERDQGCGHGLDPDVHDRVVPGEVIGSDRRRGVEAVGQALRKAAEQPTRDPRCPIGDHQRHVEQQRCDPDQADEDPQRKRGAMVGLSGSGHRRVASVNNGHGTKPNRGILP